MASDAIQTRDPIQTRDLLRDWRRVDAERLAEFWNRTGAGWPGGGWDPQTPAEIARMLRERQELGVFVAEVGDRIVSLCTLAAKPDERNRAYVGFLTADPEFHGRGYGKAVLLRAIERVRDRGIAQVDLHTWPGNLKAVPLYKKSGFMWSPDSGGWGVHMENFTPGARRHPVAREFFRKHDWYRTMKRDLSLTPDEHKRGKVRVYEYLWEEDGDRLRMVYDRQSWGLLEVETNELLVACSLDDEKLVAGLPQRIRWQVENRGGEPLDVVLVASADEGVTLDRKEVLRVGKRAALAGEFEIDPEIEEKEKEPRVPIVRTELLVNGVPITLAAGFQVRQAVGFSLDGDGQGLRPGRQERLVIQCRNELEWPVQARVRIAAPAGVELDRTSARVRIAAKGTAEVPVMVRAAERGTVGLKVEARVGTGKRAVSPKPADLYAHVLGAGDVVGHVERDRVVLESAALRVSVGRRGGWAGVLDKVRNRWDVAGIPCPEVGPPFAWEDFFQTRCEARVEQEPGRAVAVLTTSSTCRPGVMLERRIALSNLPVIEVQDALVNGSEARLEGSVQTGLRLNTRGGMAAAPGAEGVVRILSGGAGRALGEHRLSEKGKEWPEGWYAREDEEGVVVGVLWDRAERVEIHNGWCQLRRALPAAEPGRSTTPGPYYVFVGDGDYLTVRRWWQMLFGPREDREQRRPETRRPFEFGLRPRPLVIHGEERTARLVADSVGQLELQGRLSLKLPEGVRAQPRTTEFEGVNGKRGHERRVRVTRRRQMAEGAYSAECAVQIDRAIYRERQPIIVLGDPEAAVRVHGGGKGEELFRIENGVLALTVAPGFLGSAISLEGDGEELLRSAYPEARPLAWDSPWFGGIQPRLAGIGRYELAQERARARQIVRRGSQGVVWRGVRVSWSPKHERARHSGLAVDYLLAPGSGMLAVAVRTSRRTDTSGWLHAGFDLFPVVGGSYLDAVLRGQADARAVRIRCAFGGGVRGDRWVMAENPKAGEAVVLAGPGGEAGTHGQVYGREGYCIGAGVGAVHEAREARESVFFVSFTATEGARELAEALSELKGLP